MRLFVAASALLAAASATGAEVNRSTIIDAAFSKYRVSAGPLAGWRPDTLSAFVSETNMSALFASNVAKASLSGFDLCSLLDDEAVAALTRPPVIPADGIESSDDAEADALRLDTLALLRDRRDVKQLCKLANASTALTVHDLIEGFGAEDYSIYLLRDLARRDFHTLLYGLSCSPHFGIASMRLFLPDLDVIMFGRDEADAKTPFSWVHAFLAPGVLASRYIWHFFDTDPKLSSALALTWVVSDLLFWVQLLIMAIVPGARPAILRRIGMRNGVAIVSTLAYRFVFFPEVPPIVISATFHIFAFIAPIVAIVMAFWSIVAVVSAFRLRCAINSKAIIVPAVYDRVCGALRILDASPNRGFDEQSYTGLYKTVKALPEGKLGKTFWALRLGEQNPKEVCLKVLKAPEMAAEATLSIATVSAVMGAADSCRGVCEICAKSGELRHRRAQGARGRVRDRRARHH